MLRLPLRSCHAYAHVKASSPPAKRAASEPVLKNQRAYAFNIFTLFHLSSDCLRDARHGSAARFVRVLVVCLLFWALKPKLDLSWGLSWPHVGGLGACWGILRRCLDDLKAMLSHAKASSPPAQRAASEPVSKNRCAFAFNMFICQPGFLVKVPS